MKVGVLPLALIGIFTHLAAIAQAPATAPESLAAATQRQAAARDILAAEAADAQAVLQKWYHSALDALKKDATGKGDLDGVLAIEAERGRMERDLTAEEKEKLPKLMRTVRDQYDQARAQRAADYKAKIAASLRTHLATLEPLEKSLTQKSDIEGAIAVRKERAAIGEQLNGLQNGVAVAPPAPQLTAPVASTPTPATNPPGDKPPTALGTTPKAIRVAVAGVVAARTLTRDVAPEAIPFRTPPSPKTPGGKGLLLKNDPSLGSRGTTWSCFMIRTAPHDGIQIIHPLGKGHIIVHLKDDGVFFISPEEMAKTPWVGGDAKKIRLTNDGDKAFPLTNQGCHVLSQLSGSGKYTISINDKVVGRASFDPGAALTLTPEYKGEKPSGEFPLNWGPGYAAFVAGGTEKGGVLSMRDVVFQAGASLPAPEKPEK